MIAIDLSNLRTTVDLKPIFSTIPSIIPSTSIQSPILNLFSTCKSLGKVTSSKSSINSIELDASFLHNWHSILEDSCSRSS